MGNNSNLRKIELTHEQATEYGRKGGKASQAARKERQQLRAVLYDILTGDVDDEGRDLMDRLCLKCVEGLLKKQEITPDDILKLQKILGEETTEIKTNATDTRTPGERLNDLMNGRE